MINFRDLYEWRDIVDEIINDEVEKNTTQVEVPFGCGRLIVCKPTLVNNSKQLIHKIAVALHQALICDVKECDSKENNVFAKHRWKVCKMLCKD